VFHSFQTHLEASVALALQESHNDGLDGDEREEGLTVGAGLSVVSSTGLVPDRGDAHGIGEEDTGASSHSPAAVHLLGLSVPLEAVGIGTEAKGVEAVVTYEG